MKRIAFIGLGTMGLPMAERLAETGFSVVGWDVSGPARARFAGATERLEGALCGAEAVITMLPEGQHVAEVVRGATGLDLKPGALIIDCSTIDVTTSRELARDVARAGYDMLDAPVSGGAEGAARGALSFMVGGSDAALERARLLLAAMGSKITHFGGAGTGQAAKACHNMICGITALGVCEAFALAESLGLDAQAFFDLCKGAAAQSWILENRCPVPGPAPTAPASNGYAPGFAARLMAKDLRLAQAAAAAAGQETPFGREAAQRFSAFAEAGLGDLDFSAIYQVIRQRE